MKKIRVHTTLEPMYRLDADGVLEVITLSIRQYPRDGKRNFSFVLERQRFVQTPDGFGAQEISLDDTPRMEIQQSPIRKGKTMKQTIPVAVRTAQIVAQEQGFGSTPPVWFRV